MPVPARGDWLTTTEFALCITFAILCIIFVALRLWARRLRRSSLSLTDLFVLIGLFFTLGDTACKVTAILIGGKGQDTQNVSREEFIIQNKALFTAAYCWTAATCVLKVAILFLYMEIFTGPKFKKAASGLAALSALFWLGFTLAICLQCRPYAKNWDKSLPGKCVSFPAESAAGVCINVILDFAVILLPIPVVWNLQMPLRKRLFVISLFNVGIIVVGVNVARAAMTLNPSAPNYTHDSARTDILSSMELWLGVIVACIPTVGPAFSQIGITGSKFFSTRKHASSGRRSDLEGGNRQGFIPLEDRQIALQGFLPKTGATATAVKPKASSDSLGGLHDIAIQNDIEVYETRVS